MAESDDMRDEMRNAITVALTLASVVQQRVVRARERGRDDAYARLQGTQAEAEATAALERARQTVDPSDQASAQADDDHGQFAQLDDPGWWDTAGAQDIAGKWTEVQQAVDSQDPDVAAAGRQAETTMSEQLRERYDIDPAQVQTTVEQQLDGYQDQRAHPAPAVDTSAAEGLLAARADRTAPLAEADSPSREQRRGELEQTGASTDAVDSALAVEDAFPHRTDHVHHGQRRESGGEQSATQAARRSLGRRS